jgi:hypothetical protein
MKNTFKVLIALIMIGGFWSCDDDDNFMIAEPQPAAFAILTPGNGASVVITEETDQNNIGATFTWEEVDYGTPTAVTYTLEAAASGTDFADPTTLASSGATNYAATFASLQSLANALHTDPDTADPVNIDIRVKSTVGTTGSEPKYSDVITIAVTPFVPTVTEIPKLYVVGGFLNASGYGNDWTPANAPPLAAASPTSTDFEGYVYMNSTSAQYKFLPTNTSFEGDYGDTGASDGSYSGTLEQEGEVNAGLPTPTAGYYRVKANLTDLTYSLELSNWSIIGNGTAGGWTTDTPMTYNPTTKKWEVIATLIAQAAPDNGLKFRMNNDWGTNLGDNGADGSAEYNGTNISTPDGTYLIELDLSNPREYSYTMTAQ